MPAPNPVQPLSQALELPPAATRERAASEVPVRAARLRRGLLRAGALLLEGMSHGAAMAFLIPPAGSFPRPGSAQPREPGPPGTTTDERVAAALTAVGCHSESALTVIGRYAPFRRA